MIRFAGFIITYNRPLVLIRTISKVFEQSLKPEKLIIIDNSTDDSTKKAIIKLNDSRVHYLDMGYNSGPAGGAKAGLELLTKEGYDWIYWGDDDDPPRFNYEFEVLLGQSRELENIGCIGCVGHLFDFRKGELTRIKDEELLTGKGWIEVNNIGGGMIKIINAKTVNHGILPDESLFFGFEELDYDLRLMNNGFKLYANNDLFYKYRVSSGRLNHSRSINENIRKYDFNRLYFSIRNLLYILFRNKCYLAFFYLHLKNFIKAFYMLRFGLSPFVKYVKTVSKAHWHFIWRIMGNVN